MALLFFRLCRREMKASFFRRSFFFCQRGSAAKFLCVGQQAFLSALSSGQSCLFIPLQSLRVCIPRGFPLSIETSAPVHSSFCVFVVETGGQIGSCSLRAEDKVLDSQFVPPIWFCGGSGSDAIGSGDMEVRSKQTFARRWLCKFIANNLNATGWVCELVFGGLYLGHFN